MTTPTDRDLLVAALLARGEIDITPSQPKAVQQKYRVFTRSWTGLRSSEGALMARTNGSADFWLVGMVSGLKLGYRPRGGASRQPPGPKTVADVVRRALIAEGHKAFANQPGHPVNNVAPATKSPQS